MEWLSILAGGLLGGTGLGAVLVFISTRKRDASTDLAGRFDDASELAKYIREQVEAEVERQTAQMRREMQQVKDESHQMNDVIRTRETQLWMWNHRGRPGDLPALPAQILTRLGLSHLIPDDSLEDTEPLSKETP